MEQDYKICCEKCKKTYTMCEKYVERHKLKIDVTSDKGNCPFQCPSCLDDDWLLNQSTADQKYVFTELYKICVINNHDHYYYLLNGLAGTGKTTLIEKLLRRPEFKQLDICICAPTNKALDVLTSKLDIDPDQSNRSECWSFKTIFKLLKQKTNYNNGTVNFKKQVNVVPTLVKHSIIIIDEASMVDKDQFFQIMRIRSSTMKSPPVIIFIGDRCQLPPVKETTSCIFDYPKMVKFNLTEIVRSGEVLTNLSNSIRTLIEFDPLHTNISDIGNVNINNAGYVNFVSKLGQQFFFGNKDKFIQQFVKCFRQSIEDNVSPPIILTYTNNECNNLNTLCRNSIFSLSENIDHRFLPSESIVFETMYTYNGCKFSTSEQVCIKEVNTGTFVINEFDWKSIIEQFKSKVHMNDTLKEYISDVKKSLEDWDVIDGRPSITGEKGLSVCLDKMRHEINRKMKSGIEVWELKPRMEKEDENGVNKNIIVPMISDHYSEVIEDVKKIIQQASSELSDIYQSQFLLKEMIDHLFSIIWSDFYHVHCIKPFANVTYGYAITTYKSQGSTYRDVFIGIPNIVNCDKVDPLVRMKSLYTAISRASHNVHIYNTGNYAFHLMKPQKFVCDICNKSFPDSDFYKSNYHIDKACVNKILNSVASGSIKEINNEQYLIDKNKYVLELTNMVKYDNMDVYNMSNLRKINEFNKN